MYTQSPFLKKGFPEIKESNKGKFTVWAKKNGFKDACSAASAVMRKQKKYDRVLPHINKGSKVLDLACGRGELQVFLEEYLNGDVE